MPQDRSSRWRTASDARASASFLPIMMCPSSVLGTIRPSTKSAVPIPVPSVTIMTDPAAALAGAELHLGDAGRVGVVDDRHVAARRPGERGRDVDADPGRVDVRGRAGDASLHHGGERARRPGRSSRSASSAGRTTGAIVSGIAGCGVRMRSRSATSSPVAVSTGAALHAGPADVDPEHRRHGVLPLWAGPPRRGARPVSPTGRRRADRSGGSGVGRVRFESRAVPQ